MGSSKRQSMRQLEKRILKDRLHLVAAGSASHYKNVRDVVIRVLADDLRLDSDVKSWWYDTVLHLYRTGEKRCHLPAEPLATQRSGGRQSRCRRREPGTTQSRGRTRWPQSKGGGFDRRRSGISARRHPVAHVADERQRRSLTSPAAPVTVRYRRCRHARRLGPLYSRRHLARSENRCL